MLSVWESHKDQLYIQRFFILLLHLLTSKQNIEVNEESSLIICSRLTGLGRQSNGTQDYQSSQDLKAKIPEK